MIAPNLLCLLGVYVYVSSNVCLVSFVSFDVHIRALKETWFLSMAVCCDGGV